MELWEERFTVEKVKALYKPERPSGRKFITLPQIAVSTTRQIFKKPKTYDLSPTDLSFTSTSGRTSSRSTLPHRQTSRERRTRVQSHSGQAQALSGEAQHLPEGVAPRFQSQRRRGFAPDRLSDRLRGEELDRLWNVKGEWEKTKGGENMGEDDGKQKSKDA